METDVGIPGSQVLSLLQASDDGAKTGAGLADQGGAWLGFRATVSAVLLLELLLGVGGNLTVLVLYCGHCSLLESVSHAVTLSLHTLDLLLCVLCLPITATLLLLGGASAPNHVLLCCLHESASSFASVGTALNLLLISLDRYDISVRPANRLLTPRRAALLLAAVWAVSLTVPLLPFMEAGFLSGAVAVGGAVEDELVTANSTELCVQWGGVFNAHLVLQVPVFLCSLAVMLFTYSRILQALRMRIGRTPLPRNQRDPSQPRLFSSRLRRKKGGRSSPGNTTQPRLLPSPIPTSPPPLSTGPLIASDTVTTVTVTTETNNTPSVITPLSPDSTVTTVTTPLSPAPTITTVTTPQSPTPTVTTVTASLSPAPIAGAAPPHVGVGASVSAILALRRAVRRHRDRRERQRRVFRMSVIIILSFLLCWAPLSITPLLLLALGPSDWLERLRLCFLVLAYWTVVLHPLLYAFTRQKLRKVLHTRLRRMRPRNTHVLIRSAGRRSHHKHRLDHSDTMDRCLTDTARE
ncbi:G-protein coupled receptor 22 [Chanos chanos]|uniref:G-protein coupled receptor 22 n=1 Tax=Chanos chanos TaxID=29144 RepID=A0A6J2VQR1_CHACN|nr:G-protein coupled receptor 22-like [Chanos chanos]